MKYTLALLLTLWGFAPTAMANICGTDYQNFNPTTNGLDFVTVQSSETLRPCVINMGLFINYAKNSLTYSKTLNTGFEAGQKRQDETWSADLSVGMGINKRWDFGINIPFVIDQNVADNYYVSSIDKSGATEFKANTKYRLMGDESGGLAGILSVNKNLLADNPFAGDGAGPTWNFELAWDTTLASKWAIGVNGGYRLRDPGSQIVGTPFVPLEDQYIYSLAGSYHFASIDTKLILELYGSHAVKKSVQDTDRNLNSLEALAGIKHDVTQNLAVHFGGTRQIGDNLGGAEWRVYAGLNWAVGPVCGKEEKPQPVVEPAAPAEPQQEVFAMDVELLFQINSDKIDQEYLAKIASFFTEVLHRDYTKIEIEGHTDSMGEDDYNLDLSKRRAEFMRKHLIEKFKVPASKITSEGFGETKPVADNGNYQGRRKNRRVELKITRPQGKVETLKTN